MMKTAICQLLNIESPIIQGGMAWLGTAELASAVSNAGGLGLIGAGGDTPDGVREQIRRTKAMTDKPFGVNVMLMSPYTPDVMKVILEENVLIVTTGAGSPGPYIPSLKENGAKVIPVVASVALARRLERMGADAVIAEGGEAGGHVGDISTMPLIPQIVDAVTIPVIAAGGFADGRGLVAALALGAQGIQMGTRFVCSDECVAHPDFKQKIIEARDRSTVITGRETGHPVRCLANKMTKQLEEMAKTGMSLEEMEIFLGGSLRKATMDGEVENGSVMAGQISGMINDIKPCNQIITDIITEAEKIIANLALDFASN
ncbi:MAG: enoyl-[acyl-carrier-protein] reductase FabK [Dehalococcoidia bacterium]|nr:enoyl-[acyl-carrier-protein] reductase FabK [Dehalococcoidia bacterium]